jgi:DNA-3-methyladenine glycosylase II
MDQVAGEDSFIKAFRVCGQTVLSIVARSGNPGNPGLAYTLYSASSLPKGLLRAFEERLREFLSLELDLSGFYARAADDPQFRPVIQALYGYHPVRFQSPFEAAVWAILSQRNRQTTARNMYRSLITSFGHAVEWDGVIYWAFPEPEELAGCNEGDLAFVARNLRRGEFLIDAARSFALVSSDFLTSADFGEIDDWLRTINGIGPWSASFILVRGLGRGETVPLPDQGLLDAAARVYQGGLTMGPENVLTIARRYHPWQGHWAHYLRVWAQPP